MTAVVKQRHLLSVLLQALRHQGNGGKGLPRQAKVILLLPARQDAVQCVVFLSEGGQGILPVVGKKQEDAVHWLARLAGGKDRESWGIFSGVGAWLRSEGRGCWQGGGNELHMKAPLYSVRPSAPKRSVGAVALLSVLVSDTGVAACRWMLFVDGGINTRGAYSTWTSKLIVSLRIMPRTVSCNDEKTSIGWLPLLLNLYCT